MEANLTYTMRGCLKKPNVSHAISKASEGKCELSAHLTVECLQVCSLLICHQPSLGNTDLEKQVGKGREASR